MDLSIIIVNWNSVGFLRKCITSIEAETRGITYEVVVIDSASFDGCEHMLREEFPNVRFLQSHENIGFARANNAAYRVSRGKALLFLNPDTEVVGSAITTMHAYLQRLPMVGIVGCKLLNQDGSVQTSCIQSFPTIVNQMLDADWLRLRCPKSKLWGMAPLYRDQGSPESVEVVAGACLMLKRRVFEGVSLFSEDYFMYAEDIDLSYKINRAGYKNYYVPAATVVHYGGGSSQEAPSDFSVVMIRESIWKFLRKTRGRSYGLLYRISMLLCAAARLALLEVRRLSQRPQEGRATVDRSIGKWKAVIRWSLHRHQLSKQYK